MDKEDHCRTLWIKNRLTELDRISKLIDEVSEAWALSMRLHMPLNLAIEEAFTNIVNYAYSDNEEHDIEIVIEKHDRHLVVRITDDGNYYDPTTRKDPDLTLPVEKREIGGLGIYLIRQMMDQVVYVRSGERNILLLTKETVPAGSR